MPLFMTCMQQRSFFAEVMYFRDRHTYVAHIGIIYLDLFATGTDVRQLGNHHVCHQRCPAHKIGRGEQKSFMHTLYT